MVYIMSYSKTEAISLSFKQTKEADRLYTLFSAEQGKVEVLVRSAAKSQSKLAGSLDIWSLVWVMTAQGKITHLAGVQQLYHWQWKSLLDTALAAMVSQVTEGLLPIGVPESVIYRQFLQVFDFIEKAQDVQAKRFVVLRYFWQSLDRLGYLLTKSQDWTGAISASTEKLRQHCLANDPGKIMVMKGDLAELEQFTFSNIRYIIESDIPAFQWYLWQQTRD